MQKFYSIRFSDMSLYQSILLRLLVHTYIAMHVCSCRVRSSSLSIAGVLKEIRTKLYKRTFTTTSSHKHSTASRQKRHIRQPPRFSFLRLSRKDKRKKTTQATAWPGDGLRMAAGYPLEVRHACPKQTVRRRQLPGSRKHKLAMNTTQCICEERMSCVCASSVLTSEVLSLTSSLLRLFPNFRIGNSFIFLLDLYFPDSFVSVVIDPTCINLGRPEST